jgi:hypothetical protein
MPISVTKVSAEYDGYYPHLLQNFLIFQPSIAYIVNNLYESDKSERTFRRKVHAESLLELFFDAEGGVMCSS